MINAKTLRFLRSAVNMEQRQLAAACGVTSALISSIERGERPLTRPVEHKIREALGIDDQTLQTLLDAYYQANKSDT